MKRTEFLVSMARLTQEAHLTPVLLTQTDREIRNIQPSKAGWLEDLN